MPGFSAEMAISSTYRDMYSTSVNAVDSTVKIVPQAPTLFTCAQIKKGCERACKGERTCLIDCVSDVNDCFSWAYGTSFPPPGSGCKEPYEVVCHPDGFCQLVACMSR
jgi:hypothetical protein